MPDEIFVCEVPPTLVPLQCSGDIGADLRYLAQRATGAVTSCEFDEVGDAPSTHCAELVHEAAGLFATAVVLLEHQCVHELAETIAPEPPTRVSTERDTATVSWRVRSVERRMPPRSPPKPKRRWELHT